LDYSVATGEVIDMTSKKSKKSEDKHNGDVASSSDDFVVKPEAGAAPAIDTSKWPLLLKVHSHSIMIE
jgi:hypothetical protein